MKRLYKFLMALVMTVTGGSLSQAETVDNYAVDFNTSITTSDHAFKVASNWKHIVGRVSSYGDYYYMSYSYYTSGGVDSSGALYCGEQKAGEYYYDKEEIYDLLVTPVVSGEIKIKVKRGSSYNTPVFELYSLNDTGTEKNAVVKSVSSSDLSASEYTEISYTVDTPQRIGIRGGYVYLDDFSAEHAEIEPEKSVSISYANPTATTGSIMWDQQPDGNVLIKYMVKVTNNGEVALTQGMDNYSVSLVNGSTSAVIATVPVPQDLAIGAESEEFEVSAQVDPSTIWTNTYSYIKINLMENLQGTVLERAQSRYNAYEPKFVFRKAGTTTTYAYSDPCAFGVIAEEATANYEIYNDGAAPLTIKSISAPAGFVLNPTMAAGATLEIGAHSGMSLDVTLPVSTLGFFTGNLEIVYLDKDGAEQTFSLPISGTVRGANTWYADFGTSSDSYPEGSIAEGGLRTSYNWVNSAYNYYVYSYTSDTYATGSNKFITPKLHAEAGDAVSFDVATEAGSDSKYFLKVYLSTDRVNWGEPVAEYHPEDLTSTLSTKGVTIDTAGDYYIGFAVYGVKLDNVVGLTKVDVDHDLYFADFRVVSEYNSDTEVQSGEALSPAVSVIPVMAAAAADYTVTYHYGDQTATVASQDLTASAKSTTWFKNANMTIEVTETTEFDTWFEFAFADGTTFSTEVKKLKVVCEPDFVFFNKDTSVYSYKPDSRTTAINFGKVNVANATQEFEIYNWGKGVLTVKSISVPDGFSVSNECPLTVAGKAREEVDIVFSATEPGIYTGKLQIVYVDAAGDDATFELDVMGTMLDTTKWYANFDNPGGTDILWPAGAVYQKNISNSTQGSYSDKNYYITSSSSSDNMFITPKLHAEAGEMFTFDAKLYSSYWTEGAVTVYAAATREALFDENARTTLIAVSGQSEDASLKPVLTDYTTYAATIADAGDYYLGLEISGRLYVDELYGLSTVAVGHDWMDFEADVPTSAMQNVATTAKIKLHNVGLAAEEAGNYTATVYVNGKAIETTPAVEIPTTQALGSDLTVIPVEFRYGKVGTFPVYVELKADDYVMASEPVDVEFTQEVASSSVVVGEYNSTTTVPFNLNYKNSETVVLYTADDLGLADGAKISKIAIKGYNATAWNTDLTLAYEWTDDTSMSTPSSTSAYDTTNMTVVVNSESHAWEVVGSAENREDMIVYEFAEPLVYQAGKSLRLLLRSCYDGYKYTGVFETTSETRDCYQHYNDGTAAVFTASWYSKNRPVLHLDLVAEPLAVTGAVTDTDGNAVASAAIRIVSNDADEVEYNGVSDADGNYSVSIIQTDRTYSLEASAAGLRAAGIGLDLTQTPVVADVVMHKLITISRDNVAFEQTSSAYLVVEPFLSEGLNAVALPFDVTKEQAEEIFGANVQIYKYETVVRNSGVVDAYFPSVLDDEATQPSQGVAPRTAVAATDVVMEAGVPYLVQIDEAMTQTEIDGVDVVGEMGKTVGDKMDFIATAAPVSATAQMLVVDGTSLVKATEGTEIPAYSAYMLLKKDSISGANIIFTHLPSAVDAIQVEGEGNDVIYDLNGFRVKNPKKGIYIVNGKAVMVK